MPVTSEIAPVAMLTRAFILGGNDDVGDCEAGEDLTVKAVLPDTIGDASQIVPLCVAPAVVSRSTR